MSESKLRQRLSDALALQREVVGVLGSLPETQFSGYLREVASYDTEIRRALGALDVRATVRNLLSRFEDTLDPQRAEVELGSLRINADHARLALTQSYLVNAWAAADALTAGFGRILCPECKAQNASHPAKLWEDITRWKGANTSAPLHKMAHDCFGWPVGLSYAIRNHFIHDGDTIEGPDLFAGPAAVTQFHISDDGWDSVLKKMKDYQVDETHTRAPERPWPKDDLRNVLDICHREIDALLGILVGTGCAALQAQVRCLLDPS